LAERVQYMEKLLGDSADKHAAELQALRTRTASRWPRLASMPRTSRP
jgi:hypothetical protein